MCNKEFASVRIFWMFLPTHTRSQPNKNSPLKRAKKCQVQDVHLSLRDVVAACVSLDYLKALLMSSFSILLTDQSCASRFHQKYIREMVQALF